MKDRVVFLTGASRGIGRAVALLLMRRGASIVATARSEPQLRLLASYGKSGSGRCLPIQMDVRSSDSVARAVRRAVDSLGAIDVLINNAGIIGYGPLSDVSLETWNAILSTNLTGSFLCIRQVLPVMKRQRRGHIINISSHAGLYGFPNLGAYVASKFGLIGLSQSLGRELRGTGIRTSCLCPSSVDTQMMDQLPKEVSRTMRRVAPERIAERIAALIDEGEHLVSRGLIKRISRRLMRRRDPDGIVTWNSWE